MIFKAYRRRDDRYIRPSALFGSGDRNPVPMTDLAGGLLSIEADDATLTHQWGNGVHTEFGCLLNGVVHSFAAGDTLRKGNRQWRSWQRGPRRRNVQT
jgi:hypothetical protein